MSPGKRPPLSKLTRVSRRRSREARRRRFLLIGGALLSLIILGAWFPANALYHQHTNLASTESQLNTLHQQDAALAQEQKNLGNAAEIARIAREQYQLVNAGQQAFEVLPASGSSHANAPYSGDPARSGPVNPSSASELPPPTTTTTTQPTANPAATHTPSKATPSTPRHGVLGRMLDALEFWR